MLQGCGRRLSWLQEILVTQDIPEFAYDTESGFTPERSRLGRYQ